MFAFCVFSLLTTKLSIWFQTIWRHRKQICARWTCGGGGGGSDRGSPVCCGALGILLKARRRGFLVEHGGIGVHVRCVPRQRWHIWYAGHLSHLFLFALVFWSLLEHELYKKHSSIWDLVRPMMMKRNRMWHYLVFCWCLGFLHMFSVLITVNAYVQLGLLIVKC